MMMGIIISIFKKMENLTTLKKNGKRQFEKKKKGKNVILKKGKHKIGNINGNGKFFLTDKCDQFPFFCL